jgi:hypothetical protein
MYKRMYEIVVSNLGRKVVPVNPEATQLAASICELNFCLFLSIFYFVCNVFVFSAQSAPSATSASIPVSSSQTLSVSNNPTGAGILLTVLIVIYFAFIGTSTLSPPPGLNKEMLLQWLSEAEHKGVSIGALISEVKTSIHSEKVSYVCVCVCVCFNRENEKCSRTL